MGLSMHHAAQFYYCTLDYFNRILSFTGVVAKLLGKALRLRAVSVAPVLKVVAVLLILGLTYTPNMQKRLMLVAQPTVTTLLKAVKAIMNAILQLLLSI